MRSQFLVLLLLACPLVEVTAGGAPASDLKQRVRQLIIDLDANRRAVRDKARNDLIRLGPRVLPHFPAPADLKSVAARATIRRIRRTLERTQALESASATRVTFSGRRTLGQLIKIIQQQTGNRLRLANVKESVHRREFEVDFQKASFWDTVSDLCSRSELQPLVTSDGCVLAPSPGRSHSRSSDSGPFRVTVTARPPRAIVGDNKHLLIPLRLDWSAEPRLRPLYLVCRPADFSVSSSTGQRIVPRSPDATLELPLGTTGPRLQLRLDFQAPRETRIKSLSLKGRALVQLAAGTQPFVFSGLERPSIPSQRQAGVVVSLKEARFSKPRNGRYNAQVRIGVVYESGGPAFESHRTWLLHNRARLQAKGQADVAYSRLETPRLGDGTAEIVYHFENLSAPPDRWQFRYEAPTLIIRVPVELSFPQLTIPPATRNRGRPQQQGQDS